MLESRRPLAHECLGEALRVLRQVICKYPLLNTVETLTAAGTLIAKVKGQLARPEQRGLSAWKGFLEEGMFEVGFEEYLGVLWANLLQWFPWAKGPLQLVAGVVTSRSGPSPLMLVFAPQPSIMSATMRQTSRSLRRPWRPLLSPSAARERGPAGLEYGCVGPCTSAC